MEGVFLSARVPPLAELILGRSCEKVGMPVQGGLGMVFANGMLVLCARPDSSGLWWETPLRMAETESPEWGRHMQGAEVTAVRQQGADRVLEIFLRSRLLYGSSDVKVVFEATGRNANLILVRLDDDRILACRRKVTSDRSRYRTVAPGQLYRPPPPSGLPPGRWTDDPEFREALSRDPSPDVLYRSLEGVGPVTARAVLREAQRRDVPVMTVVGELEEALLKRDFHPWEGPEGPLPIRLGRGRPIEDPLQPGPETEPRSIRDHRLELWRSILRNRLSLLRNRLHKVETALEGLVPPEEYRTWGNLLISLKDSSRKGLEEIELTDWEGGTHRIPLKPARSLRSNAARFFRKASNTGRERESLESRRHLTLEEIQSLESSLESSAELGVEKLDTLIRRHRRTEGKGKGDERSIPRKVLSGGWRCFIGRNARENEEVTFRIGKRGDLWFHARGIPGAHVVLKMDGRKDNPPGGVMREAALEAARGSGASSGVIPVDYTGVQYVNRMRKGKPGQVVYTREKTIFVDMDRLQSD